MRLKWPSKGGVACYSENKRKKQQNHDDSVADFISWIFHSGLPSVHWPCQPIISNYRSPFASTLINPPKLWDVREILEWAMSSCKSIVAIWVPAYFNCRFRRSSGTDQILFWEQEKENPLGFSLENVKETPSETNRVRVERKRGENTPTPNKSDAPSMSLPIIYVFQGFRSNASYLLGDEKRIVAMAKWLMWEIQRSTS